MRTLVTHFSPDLDALSSCWLIKRYLAGWKNAQLAYVPAGETLCSSRGESKKNLIHVDTGLGEFDHHQLTKKTSATKLVFDYLSKKDCIPSKDLTALNRMVDIITSIDNFNEVFLPEPTSDIYELNLYQFLDGLKNILHDDTKAGEIAFILLDAVLIGFKNKIRAENEIEKGFVFQSKWGRSLAMENGVEESMKLAQKKGFFLVVRKDLESKIVRIKARPDCPYGLENLHQKLKEIDPQASWFLHSSKRILLNGSRKNPKTKPCKLSIKRLIEIIKSF